MPLQSGNSSPVGSPLAADALDFFIQFRRAVLQEQLPYVRSIDIESVHLHQVYHIIHVFHNSSLVAMFYGMAFEGEQVSDGNHFDRPQGWRRRHRLGHEFRERSLVNQHQIERHASRIRWIKLNKGRTFPVGFVFQRPGQLQPTVTVRATNDEIEIECRPGVAMRDHCMSTGQKEIQAQFACPSSNRLQRTHKPLSEIKSTSYARGCGHGRPR